MKVYTTNLSPNAGHESLYYQSVAQRRAYLLSLGLSVVGPGPRRAPGRGVPRTEACPGPRRAPDRDLAPTNKNRKAIYKNSVCY